jgi:hypothetical protein
MAAGTLPGLDGFQDPIVHRLQPSGMHCVMLGGSDESR